MMKAVIKTVENFIRKNSLLTDGAKAIIGLSGGPDSVCLAMILDRLGYSVIAAHCNFHLRGEESQRDDQFVESLCKQHGWTLYKIDFDTTAYARDHQQSIEMAARELRYNWFRKLKAKTTAEAIAVGHHQDDNAETLLLNLTRGTGIKGLCGMQPRNGEIIRPLLCLTRKDIMTFLAEAQTDYVIDHTNNEDLYARNKVRLNVMSELRAINPNALQNIISTMENLSEVQKVYKQAIEMAVRTCSTPQENGEIHILKSELLHSPSPISILHEVLSPLGFNKQQLKEILSATNESGRLFSANNRRLLIDRDKLILERLCYPTVQIHQETLNAQEVVINKSPAYAYLDADKLHHSLTFRTPQQGDNFAPFGMKGKRKLVSDYLTDQKLNLFEKEHQLLACDGEEIVWVVGRRVSDLYCIDEHTKQVLVLHI